MNGQGIFIAVVTICFCFVSGLSGKELKCIFLLYSENIFSILI